MAPLTVSTPPHAKPAASIENVLACGSAVTAAADIVTVASTVAELFAPTVTEVGETAIVAPKALPLKAPLNSYVMSEPLVLAIVNYRVWLMPAAEGW